MTRMGSIIIGICVLLYSCIDNIEIDLPANPFGRLVIEGVAERSQEVYRFLVNVTRTQNLEADSFQHRENASISLLMNGQEIISLDNGLPSIIPIDSFHNLYGSSKLEASFNLQVTTSEGGIYRSEEQRILESPKGSEVVVKFVKREELNNVGNIIERGYVKVFVNASLVNQQAERVSLKWDLSGVYRFVERPWIDDPFIEVQTCYVEDLFSTNRVWILPGAEVSGTDVSEFEVDEIIADHRFESGYYFTVIQKALNTDAGAYWKEVRQSISREGTIFDEPVGPVRSNITNVAGHSEEVLGFFYTAGIDTIRHSATREETGKQRHLCAFSTVSEVCCTCLLIPKSTHQKPQYWID